MSYAFHDPELERGISFREATVADDLHRLHDWMNREHVTPFWDLARPVDGIRDYLEKNLDDDHQTPYIGCLGGEPVSYWKRTASRKTSSAATTNQTPPTAACTS